MIELFYKVKLVTCKLHNSVRRMQTSAKPSDPENCYRWAL